LIVSLRVPALITNAFTDAVLNVALTPSTVATIELPLFARATLMVLACPAVPVQVSTPFTSAGVTVSITRFSSASSPLKAAVGIAERRRRFFDVRCGVTLVKTCFNAETQNPQVRSSRAISSPFTRESELESREQKGQPVRIPKQLNYTKYWNADLIASPKVKKNKKFFTRAK
jgi:hypothetical protein